MLSIIDMLKSASKIDARLAQAKQVTLVPGPAPTQVVPVLEPTVSIYKLTDGERGERASKANATREEAEAWIRERPGNEYEIVSE